MSRKGNPNWGKSEQAVVTITEFEKKVIELNLHPDQYVGSQELRGWAAKHKNTRYIPEPLLQAWGFEIDASF
jgi:hypothetical protein